MQKIVSKKAPTRNVLQPTYKFINKLMIQKHNLFEKTCVWNNNKIFQKQNKFKNKG